MLYTVHELATLAGVSVRTLHHYDEIKLLIPTRLEENRYRQYGEKELLRLQQILFFKELDFPLEKIRKLLESPEFDTVDALRTHQQLLKLQKKRLNGLIRTIDKTIQKITKETAMEDKELYGNFSKEEMDSYAEEAKERWGETDAYKQSMERVNKMSKEELKKIGEEGDALLREIATHMEEDPASDVVQDLMAKHYKGLMAFYEPNLQIYRGLANMYVDDSRFTATFDKVKPGLAVFMRDAMLAYCDKNEEKSGE
jgi:DNA-binding transcriptional MerR regulator